MVRIFNILKESYAHSLSLYIIYIDYYIYYYITQNYSKKK